MGEDEFFLMLILLLIILAEPFWFCLYDRRKSGYFIVPIFVDIIIAFFISLIYQDILEDYECFICVLASIFVGTLICMILYKLFFRRHYDINDKKREWLRLYIGMLSLILVCNFLIVPLFIRIKNPDFSTSSWFSIITAMYFSFHGVCVDNKGLGYYLEVIDDSAHPHLDVDFRQCYFLEGNILLIQIIVFIVGILLTVFVVNYLYIRRANKIIKGVEDTVPKKRVYKSVVRLEPEKIVISKYVIRRIVFAILFVGILLSVLCTFFGFGIHKQVIYTDSHGSPSLDSPYVTLCPVLTSWDKHSMESTDRNVFTVTYLGFHKDAEASPEDFAGLGCIDIGACSSREFIILFLSIDYATHDVGGSVITWHCWLGHLLNILIITGVILFIRFKRQRKRKLNDSLAKDKSV